MKTRGIRNNNPGNIRYVAKTPWRGRVPLHLKKDKAFEEFESMALGYRALMITLRTYIQRDRLNTVRKIIGRWAPPEDNNHTDAYIASVCKDTGFGSDQVLSFDRSTAIALAKAISRVENGVEAVTEDVEAGWVLIESHV